MQRRRDPGGVDFPHGRRGHAGGQRQAGKKPTEDAVADDQVRFFALCRPAMAWRAVAASASKRTFGAQSCVDGRDSVGHEVTRPRVAPPKRPNAPFVAIGAGHEDHGSTRLQRRSRVRPPPLRRRIRSRGPAGSPCPGKGGIIAGPEEFFGARRDAGPGDIDHKIARSGIPSGPARRLRCPSAREESPLRCPCPDSLVTCACAPLWPRLCLWVVSLP
jgi:hypothetical protein